MDDRTQLYVKDWGSGTGRPVILLAGWPLTADSWDDQALVLAGSGHRVIAYDRRGFGRSAQPWSGYDYDTLSDDLAAVIDHTGASDAIQQIKPVIHALAASTLVVDCTVEGLMHAPELPAILKGGTRVIYISNEHPEALVRLMPDDATEARVKDHIKRLRATKAMTVSSPAGTNLRISLEGAVAGGNWGFTTRPGTLTHWPGGIALAFPAAGSVNGTLVLASGDVNLTFKRYVESAITLTIENDYVTAIEGAGLDAKLMRSYIEAWGDREAYAVSHVGYGLCDAARWDSMALYDKRDFNGTELRAFAGNFLYSTGANEVAGRHTAGHFDLPMRHCTVQLDDVTVVDTGKVVA